MTVVTLTTDFGSRDAYAAAMKGVVLSLASDAVVVDVTHEIPRHDVLAGALALAQAAPYFPPGSVHVAVVDPGVGGARAGLIVEAGGRAFIGPDNGLLSLAARPPRAVFHIEHPDFRAPSVSPTFHGRDVFAVSAGRLASGWTVQAAGPAVAAMVELADTSDGPLQAECRGRVLYIDGFGNLITSLAGESTAGRWQLHCGGRHVDLAGGASYCDVGEGELVLYVGSSGRIELAVRNGSAAERLAVLVGAPFELRRLS